MRPSFRIVLSLVLIFCLTGCERTSHADHDHPPAAAEAAEILTPRSVDLMQSDLAFWDGGTVIVSTVEAPPNTRLPIHYHNGEEYIYILEGSVVAWLKDEPEVVLKKGDVFKIPYQKVHTAITREHSVKALVFRVHEKGKPARVMVND